ncbi:Trm112 family protein [Inquilinus sp. CAU 1745]|uniref:Trm112 family protein n=1 Tax=Inquilinus sp. CAU 1745 TaxID=3140369 RepID=UPI00325AFE82
MSDKPADGPVSPAPARGPAARAGVDPKLLEILVCPLTKAPLRYDPDAQELISDQARLAYPIRDGIPIMLVDEARPLDADAQR